jgi:superfamily II DNA/RNA helicase
VISPTRELSMQTFGVLKELMKYHHHTYGLIMGGANRQTEVQKLAKGRDRGQWFLSKQHNISISAET